MLPEEERVFRVEVVEHLLAGGIPLRKADHLRCLLERGGYRLTSSSKLGELIPTVADMEMKKLSEELRLPVAGPGQQATSDRDFSVIFDGATRLGEAIAIVVRYVDENWVIQQRLVRIDVVAKSVTAVQLSRVLMECLFTRLQLRGQQILAIVRDGVSVNGAAINNMRPFLPNALDVVCFSHTLDNVGDHFDTPVLEQFGQHWIRLFATSCKAKLLWKEMTGEAARSFSETRWWSRWEVYHQVSSDLETELCWILLSADSSF